jgi:hypothetical protein
MNRIETFLSSYNLDLSDCHPDWIDMVEEYDGIKSALPESVREQKEKDIIAIFSKFHTIEQEEVEKKAVVKDPVKKKKPAAAVKQKIEYSHDIDAKSLLDKADSIVNEIE